MVPATNTAIRGAAERRGLAKGPGRALAGVWSRSGLQMMLTAVLMGSSMLSSCQGPGGVSNFYYGDGAVCSTDLGPKTTALQSSLEPLRAEFDRFSEVPRVVALIPHVGCEKGSAVLQQQVLDAYPHSDLRLIVIWQDIARTESAAEAAGRATLCLTDPRVSAFHDCAGLAGRAFARGNLPVAEAREVFLFYPAGVTWPQPGASRSLARGGVAASSGLRSFSGGGTNSRSGTGFDRSVSAVGALARDHVVDRKARDRGAARRGGISDVTPRTDLWVHRISRVAPERFCTPQELPGQMRQAVRRLLEQADARRQRVAGR